MYIDNTTKSILLPSFLGLSLLMSMYAIISDFIYEIPFVNATSNQANDISTSMTDDSQASLSAEPTRAVPPNGDCPEGTIQATPPLNPQLGCIPNTITSGPNTDDSQASLSAEPTRAVPPNGDCPEGTIQATPPLNPQLGCIPNTITSGPNRPGSGTGSRFRRPAR